MPFLKTLGRRAHSLPVVAIVLSLLVLAGLYFARKPVFAANPAPDSDTVRIATFNTEYWHIPEQELVDAVRYQDMDVVFFQEHLEKRGNTWGPTDRIAQLKAVLKDRHVAVNGEVVTVSKWPILRTHAFSGGEALRVDVHGPRGRVISAYNVHLPVHLHLELITHPIRFYQDAEAIAARRQQLLDEVIADITANGNPIIVAGDFNSSAAMHGTEWFRQKLLDAYVAPHCPHASDTFELARLLTWRIDYVYVSSHFEPTRYCTQREPAISDHQAVMVDLNLTPHPAAPSLSSRKNP